MPLNNITNAHVSGGPSPEKPKGRPTTSSDDYLRSGIPSDSGLADTTLIASGTTTAENGIGKPFLFEKDMTGKGWAGNVGNGFEMFGETVSKVEKAQQAAKLEAELEADSVAKRFDKLEEEHLRDQEKNRKAFLEIKEAMARLAELLAKFLANVTVMASIDHPLPWRLACPLPWRFACPLHWRLAFHAPFADGSQSAPIFHAPPLLSLAGAGGAQLLCRWPPHCARERPEDRP